MHELFSLEDVLNVLIELETLGNIHYTEMGKLTDDYRLKEFFAKLATQELAHKDLYSGYKKNNITFNTSEISKEYVSYMDALLKGTVKFLETNRTMRDFNHGYEIAINLEKDTILFLSEIRSIVDPSYYEVIDNIMNQERGHLQALYEYQK